MTFVNEVPTEEEIEKYGLPYGNDKNVKPELRRIWTVDHDRNFHLTVGISGKQERDEEVKWRCTLYLNEARFRIFVMPGEGSLAFTDNPYVVRYGPIESIWAIRTDIDQSVPLPKSAWDQPDTPQPLLDGRSLNEVVDILKEGLGTFRAGDSNRNIHNQHLQAGQYIAAGGAVRSMNDVWFAVDTARTVDNDLVAVGDTIAALPEIVGFGNVHSLRQAMARDTKSRRWRDGATMPTNEAKWEIAA